jgi:hypothetical protein
VCLICTIPSFSQDDYDRSLNELEKVNDLLLDASASFLKFPNNHSNTIIVFNQLKELNTYIKKYNLTNMKFFQNGIIIK